MANYSKQIAAARKAMTKKGMAMVFVRVESIQDPETGSMIKKRVESNFFGVRVNPKAEEITAGMFPVDSVIILAAGGTIPKPSTADEIQFNGNRWAIDAVHTIAPAEQDILYKIQVHDIGDI